VTRRIIVAAAVALVLALVYHGVGVALFAPRFASDDPREVLTAYYTAQRWGYFGMAEAALDPEERTSRHAPNYVRPIIKDTLFLGDLVVSQPAAIPLYGEHAEELQFAVTYTSRWRNEIGEASGGRHWFVYMGRDPGEPWRVLSEGTGP
jgi:hypothetical protein